MHFLRYLIAATLTCLIVTSAPTSDAPKFRVADLSWLAGSWKSLPGDGPTSEETWSEPAGGTMIGMFRMQSAKPLFEFLLIEDDDKGVIKRFKHFRSGYVDVEKEPLTLRVTELTAQKVTFTATAEGKLKSIVYEREGDDKLTATVNTSRNDKPFKIEVKFERAKAR